MTYHIAAIASLVVVCTNAAYTQAPSGSQSNPASSTAVTITGCVERADQVIRGTIGTTVDSQSFVLTSATNGTAAVQPNSTSGAPSASTGNSKGSLYRLNAEASTLNSHVGHRVEITGTLDSLAPPPPSDAASRELAATAPELRVGSVKMLSETCAR